MGICWSCQSELDDGDAVRIDAETAIPCCQSCWANMPECQRLQIGLRFRDGPEVSELVRSLTVALQQAVGGPFSLLNRMDGEN